MAALIIEESFWYYGLPLVTMVDRSQKDMEIVALEDFGLMVANNCCTSLKRKQSVHELGCWVRPIWSQLRAVNERKRVTRSYEGSSHIEILECQRYPYKRVAIRIPGSDSTSQLTCPRILVG